MKYIHLYIGLLLPFASLAQEQQSDSILLKQIESELKDTAVTAAPRSNLSFNPDIGLIGDFRGAYTSRGKRNLDAYLDETEISIQSVVDPYIRADVFLSLSRDPSNHEYGIEVEEGYLTTLTLPARLQLRAGKFKQAAGKINSLHSHALPFVDMPKPYVNFFGADGLNDEGISLSWLVPVNSFYQELIFEATSGYNESPLFRRSEANRFMYLGHLKNVFTLNDNSTFEFGLTAISGPDPYQSVTNVFAADLTYKWKPVRLNTYHSLTWSGEFYYGDLSGAGTVENNPKGFFTYIEYQLAKRWFITGRYDLSGHIYYSGLVDQAASLTATWQASEFHRLQLECKESFGHVTSAYTEAWLRWIFIIGAHGAHKY